MSMFELTRADEPGAGAGPPGVNRLAQNGVQVFTINPRSRDEGGYWPDIQRNIELCAAFGATGVLCFSGNDTQIDPWLVANQVAVTRNAQRRPLTPMVALNPNTMPPYTAAKMISSLEQMHGGRVALNLITGLSARDREVLGDTLDHEARYERLGEYMSVIHRLLVDERPVDHVGRYFQLREAVLLPRSRPRRAPAYFLAGHSAAAERLADAVGALRMRMLTPEVDKFNAGVAVHLGLIAGEDDDDAWRLARTVAPEDPAGQAVLQATMRFTDSEWKQQLMARLSREAETDGPYWLGPFRNFQSDCPWLVGSYDRLAKILRDLLATGLSTFVLDLPPRRDVFERAATTFARAYD